MLIDYLASDALAGQDLRHAHFNSPYGSVLLVADGRDRLVFLGFCSKAETKGELAALAKKWRVKTMNEDLAGLTAMKQAIFSASQLQLASLSDSQVRLALCGTPFQHCVWRRLLAIESGQVSSYGALATLLGSHARAIGGAVGANPVSLLVPCHRVLAADGSLNGYRWGLSVKQQILAAEGVALAA